MRRFAWIGGVMLVTSMLGACGPTPPAGAVSAGGLDTTFAASGVENLDLLSGAVTSEFIDGRPVVLDDGTLVHAEGLAFRANTETPSPVDYYDDSALVVLHPKGTLRTWARMPYTLYPDGSPGTGNGASVAAYPGGRIVATAGGAKYRAGGAQVFRLDEDLQGDPTFGTDGTVNLPATYGTWSTVSVRQVAVDPVGRIDVMLDVTGPGPSLNVAVVVTRLLTDGSLDPSFGDGGWTLVPNTFQPDPDTARPADLQVDSAGRPVLLSKGVGNAARITRLTAAGQPDPTWTDVVAADAFANPQFITIDSLDRVVTLAGQPGAESVVRYVDGVPDPTFDDSATAGTYEPMFAIMAPDGRLLIEAHKSGDILKPYLEVLLPNGQPDTTVAAGGLLYLQGTLQAETVEACNLALGQDCQGWGLVLTDGGTRIIDWLQMDTKTAAAKLIAP